MTIQNNNANESNQKNWFMNETFRASVVYSKLTGMKYKYVLGLDIGHGETVAYLGVMKARKMVNGLLTEVDYMTAIEKDDKAVELYFDIDRIPLNEAKELKIATMIGFKDKKIFIGRDAKKIPDFYQHFKTEPANWKNEYRNRKFGDLMEAFIRELWKDIKKYNSKMDTAVKNGELLIAVGCPSSPAWTSAEAVQKYQKLIERATGCSHVTVMAESTAAIMSAVSDINEIEKNNDQEKKADNEVEANNDREEKKDILLNRGLAVIDAGSSTIDFTYVLLGKQLITRSLLVAGCDLDEQILASVLVKQKKEKKIINIPDERKADVMIQIREIKEEFYPDQISLKSKVLQVQANDLICFDANKELMNNALNRCAIQVDAFQPVRSWAEQLRKFVSDCHALIKDDANNKFLCEKVILTGGTSKVPLLRDIVKEVFKECGDPLNSRDTSDSVAKGLCYAKCMEIKGGSAVENYKKEVEQLATEGYEAFIKDLATYLAKEVCNDIQKVIDKHFSSKEKVTAGMLLNDVKKQVSENEKLTEEECQKKVLEFFIKHFQKEETEIHKKANVVSKNIYGADNTFIPKIPSMTGEEINKMISGLDIPSVIQDSWVNSTIEAINFSNISTALFFLGAGMIEIPPLGLSLMALSALLTIDEVKQGVMQFILKDKTVIPRWMLRKIKKSMTVSQKRSKSVSDSIRKSEENLKKHNFLKKEFITNIRAQAEIALGKLLFMVYDERPDTN